MATINFRIDDAIEPKMKARAAEVRYRTLSDYLRELVLADLKKAAKPPRVPQKSDD